MGFGMVGGVSCTLYFVAILGFITLANNISHGLYAIKSTTDYYLEKSDKKHIQFHFNETLVFCFGYTFARLNVEVWKAEDDHLNSLYQNESHEIN